MMIVEINKMDSVGIIEKINKVNIYIEFIYK